MQSLRNYGNSGQWEEYYEISKFNNIAVNQCPEIWCFSHGSVATPRLDGIIVEVYRKWIWQKENLAKHFNDLAIEKQVWDLEDDVNKTLQKLWVS